MSNILDHTVVIIQCFQNVMGAKWNMSLIFFSKLALLWFISTFVTFFLLFIISKFLKKVKLLCADGILITDLGFC